MGYVPAPLVCRVLSYVGLAKPYHFQGVKRAIVRSRPAGDPRKPVRSHISEEDLPDRCLGRRSGEL